MRQNTVKRLTGRLITTTDVKRRAQAALLHPLSLLALIVLLVNDFVLKAVWPGTWITGKLSDLAFVIFAPPSITYLLTRFSRQNSKASNIAWICGYIVLPVLYATYNAFEPLHDFIMGGFAVITGSLGSSPFDPTDNIVVPFGVAIALWAWRTTGPDIHTARPKLAVAVALIAAFATIATSESPHTSGFTEVTGDGNGRVDIYGHGATSFVSLDGGLTWMPHNRLTWMPRYRLAETETAADANYADDSNDDPGAQRQPLQGVYGIEGNHVVFKHGDQKQRVFSGPVFIPAGDINTIRLAVKNENIEAVYLAPQDLHVDESTGNVIVALGFQGVAVGTPDGEWRRIPVGYPKVDLSLGGRMKLLLGSLDIVFVSVAVAVVAVTAALGLSGIRVATANVRRLVAILAGACVFVSWSVYVYWFTGGVGANMTLVSGALFWILVPIVILMIPASIVCFFVYKARSAKATNMLVLVLALLPIVPLALAMPILDPLRSDDFLLSEFLVISVSSITALCSSFAMIVILATARSLRVLLVTISAMLLMALTSFAAYFMWLIVGMQIYLYSLLAAGLATCIGYLLVRYLSGNGKIAGTPFREPIDEQSLS